MTAKTKQTNKHTLTIKYFFWSEQCSAVYYSLDDEVELGADQHDDAKEGGCGTVHHWRERVLCGHHHTTVPVADRSHKALWRTPGTKKQMYQWLACEL